MSVAEKRTALSIAQRHYGSLLPGWVASMADECDRTSQKAMAERIKRSPALVNQVLKNLYKGDLSDVRRRVEAVLQPSCINCPVLGAISGQECIKNQGKPYNPSNNLSVRLFLSCRKCPNRITKSGGTDVTE